MTTPIDKRAFANEAEKALDQPLVKSVIEEQLDNLNRNYDVPQEGLAKYGLTKIAFYAATVARAQALGIDPEELRL